MYLVKKIKKFPVPLTIKKKRSDEAAPVKIRGWINKSDK